MTGSLKKKKKGGRNFRMFRTQMPEPVLYSENLQWEQCGYKTENLAQGVGPTIHLSIGMSTPRL